MKRFFSILTLMCMVLVVSPYADAKKFGGGKKMGKSYKTAPANNFSDNSNTPSNGQKVTPTSSKKGMIAGAVGGLIAGGLLASMFGGSFDGLQIMDMIFFALLAFILFKVFKKMMASRHKNASYAGGSSFSGHSSSFGGYHEKRAFTSSAGHAGNWQPTNSEHVPLNLPAGFDVSAFITGAREHYCILQDAWNHNNLEKIREYVSTDLFRNLVQERESLAGEQFTEVMFVDAKIVRADQDHRRAELSLQFSGRYRDTKEGKEESIYDLWHLERDLTQPNAPWLIVGIENT